MKVVGRVIRLLDANTIAPGVSYDVSSAKPTENKRERTNRLRPRQQLGSGCSAAQDARQHVVAVAAAV